MNTWKTVLNNSYSLKGICSISDNRLLINTFSGIRNLYPTEKGFIVSPATEFPDSIWYKVLIVTQDDKFACSNSGEFLDIFSIHKDSIHLDTSLSLKTLVTCFWEDTKNHLVWLGTDQGLIKLDEEKLTLTRVSSKENSFPIQSIIEDRNGKIWYTSNEGIGCYDTLTKKTYRFRKEDGLPSNNFNINSGCIDSNGNIWFGSNKGLIRFNPDSIQAYPHSPRVYISDLKINNRPYSGDTIVSEKSNFSLNPEQNTLFFQLSTVGFHQSHLVKIYYRLVGNTEEWKLYDEENKLLFAGLAAHEYRLEWKTINSHGVKSSINGC